MTEYMGSAGELLPSDDRDDAAHHRGRTIAAATHIFTDTQSVIAELAPEAPLYLFSPTCLTAQAKRFQQGFPGMVSYAVKANPNPLVLQTLIEAGIEAFDVASIQEVELIRSILPTAELHFNNPIRSDSAVLESYRNHGVRSFVVDDQAGLTQVLEQCQPMAGELEITVRFTQRDNQQAYDFGSKFGAFPEEVVPLLTAIKAAKQRVSLTFHPGSQCDDHHLYGEYIKMAAQFAESADVVIHSLNVGGGFPIAYRNQSVAELKDYFAVIDATFRETALGEEDSVTTLVCEPGRAMVADCMSLLVNVLHRRESGDVFINDGIYGSFQEQMIIDIALPSITWKAHQPSEAALVEQTVFGPTCDPTDKLPQRPIAGDTTKGDRIEFGLLGAYAVATATTFNGFPIPNMVCVDRHSFMPRWAS